MYVQIDRVLLVVSKHGDLLDNSSINLLLYLNIFVFIGFDDNDVRQRVKEKHKTKIKKTQYTPRTI